MKPTRPASVLGRDGEGPTTPIGKLDESRILTQLHDAVIEQLSDVLALVEDNLPDTVSVE